MSKTCISLWSATTGH